jgi:hypothetical protein
MSLRAGVAVFVAIISLSCADSASAPVDQTPGASAARSVVILRKGAPADSMELIRYYGTVPVAVQVRDGNGVIVAPSSYRTEWGTTNPAFVDVLIEGAQTFGIAKRDGTAKLIARVGDARDTLALVIRQVAITMRTQQDTLVVPAPGAVRLDGGSTTGYDTMRFTSERIDSLGNVATTPNDSITFALLDSLVFVTAEARGDTARITGRAPGTSIFFGQFGRYSRVISAQVVSAFSVVRITEKTGGTIAVLPDTARIAAGSAIIFQNETKSVVSFKGDLAPAWRVGPVPPNGREGQLFTQAGTFRYAYGGATHVVIVSP